MDFVLDIKEKEVSAPKAPSFPQAKSSASSGFPEHKKRSRVSAFKQKRQGGDDATSQNIPIFTTGSTVPLKPEPKENNYDAQSSRKGATYEESERQRIDRENNERLAGMSSQEIEEARQELFGGLDPSILQMLLKRANLDESSGPSPFDESDSTKQSLPEIKIEDTTTDAKPRTARGPSETPKKVSFASTESEIPSASTSKPPPRPTVEDAEDEAILSQTSHKPSTGPDLDVDDDAAPAAPVSAETIPPSSTSEGDHKPHWPRSRQPPDLNPDDPNFLQTLHEKYFPSLPADPSKLAWMAPIPTPNSPADLDSPYHPGQSSLPVSQLRFDFRGALLPPRVSRAIPVTKGLHHHGEAPEAAGYTVAELARYARSSVPGQRCMAFQTVGRILFRLGKGEWGGPENDLARGIWACCEEGNIIPSLLEGAETNGHRSAQAYAVEALWLFEKGGWKGKLKKAR